MKRRALWILCGIVVLSTSTISGTQNKGADSASRDAKVSANYPSDRTGILILGPDWIVIHNEVPARSRLKHGLAPALTYGAAPAEIVSEYQGPHAQTQIAPGRPIICVCHIISLPGNPLIVRLHAKKGSRELDGGKIHIGAKLEEVEKNDLIAIDVSQPEDGVWLIRPQQELPPGEYAVMLGAQNVSIFAFSVIESGAVQPSSSKQ